MARIRLCRDCNEVFRTDMKNARVCTHCVLRNKKAGDEKRRKHFQAIKEMK